jgi:uracil-DNA glycosylase family 4
VAPRLNAGVLQLSRDSGHGDSPYLELSLMRLLPVAPAEGCTLCPLHETSKKVCVGARLADGPRQLLGANGDLNGVSPVRFLLVGEALGYNEEKQGLPFVGKAGKLLDKVLEILANKGLRLNQVAVTNAVRCRPPENRSPKMAEKRKCRPYLDAEIDALQPDLVVALGAQAWSSLHDKANGASVAKDRLKHYPYVTESGYEVPMMVTYHPAAALRDASKKIPMLEDLHAYLVESIYDDTPVPRPNVFTVNTLKGLEGILGKLRRAKEVSLDIETMGFTSSVLTIALSFPPYKSAYVIPVLHRESQLPSRKVLAGIKELVLDRGDMTVIGQHIKYDLGKLMQATGARVVKCLGKDTMAYHYCLDEHAGNRSLDYLSRRYTKHGGYKEDVDHSNLSNEKLERLAVYNGTDTVTPPDIIKKLTSDLKTFGYFSQPLLNWYERVMPFAAVLEANGMAIDRRELGACRKFYRTRVTKKKNSLLALHGGDPPDTFLNSPAQLSSYIFGDLGLESPNIHGALTKSGMKSTSKAVIEAMAGEHPFTDGLISYRSAKKMLGTYVEGLYKELEADGCVHPSYFVVATPFGATQEAYSGGTVAGRLSAKNPAVQTIPKGERLRGCFVSRYPKGEVWNIDGAQFELRYGAWLFQDPNILRACASEDPHAVTAELAGVSRDIGKRINFACIYGVTESGLVDKAGIDLATAHHIVPMMRDLWRVLYAGLEDVANQAIKYGQVSTPYKAWRRVFDATLKTGEGRHLVRSAQNFVIQRPASDIVQLLGWRLMLELEGIADVITTTHDSITMDVRPDKKAAAHSITQSVVQEQWLTDVKDVLELDLAGVPWDFDLTSGKSWLYQTDLARFRAA